MERHEHEVISEVSRVVNNYNAAISESDSYDGSGVITLTRSPEDIAEFIDNVLLAMQHHKLELEKVGESDVAETVNHCVLQVHDLKTEIAPDKAS